MPAQNAITTVYASGLETRFAKPWSFSLKVSGEMPVHLKISTIGSAAAMPTGKPIASARKDCTAEPGCRRRARRKGRDRPELGTEDHGADDQDRAVEQQSDRCKNRRQHHERRSRRSAPSNMEISSSTSSQTTASCWLARSGALGGVGRRGEHHVQLLNGDRPSSTTRVCRRSAMSRLAASRGTSHMIRSPAGLRDTPGRTTMFSTVGSLSSSPCTADEHESGATIRRCTMGRTLERGGDPEKRMLGT